MAKEEKAIQKRLDAIEDKLKSIDGKLSEKWFLPVFITLLTAFLGTVTFLIERNVNKGDVSEIKQSEVIGEYIAKSKIEFYRNCKERLVNIDERFESFCKIGQNSDDEDKLDSLLIAFRKFILSQQVIDQDVLNPVQKYSEYISEQAFEIVYKDMDKAKVPIVYSESKSLYNDAIEKLTAGINKLPDK